MATQPAPNNAKEEVAKPKIGNATIETPLTIAIFLHLLTTVLLSTISFDNL